MTEKIGVTYLPVITPLEGSAYHMALFYDKGDGSTPRVIEFGPENESLGTSEKMQEVLNDLWGNHGGMSRFGHLIGRDREWRTQGFDPQSNDSLRLQEILAEGNDLSAPWAIIQGTKAEANVSRYPYLPWSQNSNTSAMEAAARAGLRRPSGVATDVNGDVHVCWPPGAGNRLTSPESSDIGAQPMSYEFTTSRDEPAPMVNALSLPLQATPPRGVPGASGSPFWSQSYPGGDGSALPASTLQTQAPSDELPALWNGFPIPPALREVAAWARRTAPQPEPNPGTALAPPQAQMTPQELPTLWNGFPIPPALREVAAWASRTGPQANPDVSGTAPTGAPGQIAPQRASAPGQQSPESLLPPELRPLVRFFGLDDS